MATIAERIKEAMNLRGMKQVDLVAKTGIGKSSISTYLAGEYIPKQKNIHKIAKALDVSEAWLIGEDVPMERLDSVDWNDSTAGLSDETKSGHKAFYKIMMDIMDEKNLDIPDFARACNLSDRAIRSIIIRHSKTAPLDMALKISAAFDIPLEYLNGDIPRPATQKLIVNETSSDESRLLDLYRKMNSEGQERVIEYAEDLVAGRRYIKSNETVMDKEA